METSEKDEKEQIINEKSQEHEKEKDMETDQELTRSSRVAKAIPQLVKQIQGYLETKPLFRYADWYEDCVCWESLDNDDYWDEELSQYRTKDMFEQLKPDGDEVCIVYAFDDYEASSKKKNAARKEAMALGRALYGLRFSIGFRLYVCVTTYWRVGIDGHTYSWTEDGLHPQSQDDLIDEKDQTWYLIVTSSRLDI